MRNPTCNYCKRKVGANPDNEIVWNGFYDKDTKQFVCWDCQDRHYRRKAKTKFRFRYSEIPVMLSLLMLLFTTITIFAQDTSNTHKIRLDFNEPMMRSTLFENSNYTVFDDSLNETTIRDVGVLPGDTSVVVYVDWLWYKTSFAIRVFNVKDTSGNVINQEKNSAWFYFNGFDSTIIQSKFNLGRNSW